MKRYPYVDRKTGRTIHGPCCERPEEWRETPGLPGYQVSNRGRMRRLTAAGVEMLEPWVDPETGKLMVEIEFPDGEVPDWAK